MRAAVLVILHRRPWLIPEQFQALRAARVPLLVLAADAAADEHQADDCRAVLDAVDSEVDWAPTLVRDVSPVHLGLSGRVISAIDRALLHADQVVVLEDDCIPDPGFFQYAEEMLDRFRRDPRVWMIAGGRPLNSPRVEESSYGFSWYPFVWGWATWRDRWTKARLSTRTWDLASVESFLSTQFAPGVEHGYWITKTTKAMRGHDAWDYLWFYEMRRHGGLCAVPNWNMVRNVGFDNAATHTNSLEDFASRSVPLDRPEFPLRHAASVARDPLADKFAAQKTFIRSWRPGMG